MEPGRELDALIAEKIFGKVRCQGERCQSQPYCHANPDSPTMGGETPNYSEDIAAAWTVVEKLREKHWWFMLDCYHGEWSVRLDNQSHGQEIISKISAPHAICLAALETVENL